MPAKSKAQFKLMAAAEHNPQFAKKVGISSSVAKDFVEKTKSYKALPKKVTRKKK
jgi:hypothetical protein